MLACYIRTYISVFFCTLSLCLVPAATEGDVCPRKMLKIMEHIFMMTACHASADVIVCQTRDELHDPRKVEFILRL